MNTTESTAAILANGPSVVGVDASEDRRPGVPMENSPPRPVEGAHWVEPEHQVPTGKKVLKRKGLEELTPVFSEAIPPRGVSGVMRRAAYAIPEHYTSHWLVLLLADRVDAVESRALRMLPFALPVAGVGVGYLAYRRFARR